MEDLLVQEQKTYDDVQRAFDDEGETFASLSETLSAYREACAACIFMDFGSDRARKYEVKLWGAHTHAKQYYHRGLSKMRKGNDGNSMSIRQLKRMYKEFVKASTKFYREYILRIITAFNGIPELDNVAQHVRNDFSLSESSQVFVTSAMRRVALKSVHQVLIYLGDLSRYRASEGLDPTPNYGPAIGYYGLACTLQPTSGTGHHQQAVIALEQRHHLRAIFHLYRATCVEAPHPNAVNNLKLEFDKVNQAWDRGDLIKKEPNDPDAPKHALTGWFVRLQSMCYKGEVFRSYDELEREVLSQLSAILRLRPLDNSLFRMVTVNMAAQATVAQDFQNSQSSQAQQAFFYLLRLNIKTFSTLLGLFYDGLREVYRSLTTDDEEELAARLEPVAQRTLPALRMYSCWIMPNLHIIEGLSGDDFLAEPIEHFWRTYARTLTLVAAAFPIWDLEELPEVTYILPEDGETLGFLPMLDDKTRKVWYLGDGQQKPRFCDLGVTRLSLSDEMLSRVKDFLSVGLDLATSEDGTPIKLKGTHIVYGDEPVEDAPLPKKYVQETIEPSTDSKQEASVPTQTPSPPKPTSWASIAANGHAKNPNATSKLSEFHDPARASNYQSRDDQLSRMVDDLVHDDEENDLATPPQQVANMPPPLIASSGEILTNARDVMAKTDWRAGAKAPQGEPVTSRRPGSPYTPKGHMTPNGTKQVSSTPRYTAASVWGNSSGGSSFPSGLPMGTVSSPVHINGKGHSRVNSASSNRSRSSLKMAESWSSLESTPKPAAMANGMQVNGVYANGYASIDQHGIAIPLLFGAGGGVWSTGRTTFFGATTSPDRHAG